jgi:predicted RNA-binding Zn-ribbon protein involved in translation (DUF1610 family)
MTEAPIPFPYDDPAWDAASDAYLKTDTRDLLQEITDIWSDETADYLLFSALLHQNTVYSATFLALPHLVALADVVPPAHRRQIALFLAGVALHGQLPRTSGGVSLAPGDPWAETPTGRKAGQVFKDLLPEIARLCEVSYREDPNAWFASGMAAARGDLALAQRLETGELAVATCPQCGAEAVTSNADRCPNCGWTGPMLSP